MLRRLINRLRGGNDAPPPAASESRDFTREREDNRQAGLSDEDRDWEQASLQRDRDRRERESTAPGQ